VHLTFTDRMVITMAQEKPKILTVDDRAENLYALDKLLKTLDVEVIQALSGAEALNLTLEHDFCLTIVDIQMPEMDGYELVELLRSNEDTATLPAIFVSAIYSDEYHHRKGYEAGAVDFMSKPFVPEILLSKVKAFVDLYRQRKSLEDEVKQRRQAEAALQEANVTLSKRAVQLGASSQIGRQVTSILDLDELLPKVIELIQAKFGYYFVGVWLLNERQTGIASRVSKGRNRNSSIEKGPDIPMDSAHGIVISVCRSGQYYLSNDTTTDVQYSPELSGTRSQLVLPLRIGPHPIGALDVRSERLAAFGPDDIPVLQMLADQLSIPIRNAQLYDAEKQRRQLAESLGQMGRVLASSLDMAEVPNLILEQLISVVPYDRGAVLLREGDLARVIAQLGFQGPWPKDVTIPIRQGDVFQQLIETRHPTLVDDIVTEPVWRPGDEPSTHHAWLGVPLISKDQVIGIISLVRQETGTFKAEDVPLVSAFASQAAVALENASLYERLAHFNEELEQLVQQRTDELERAYETLSRIDKTKSDFITVAAHELRTPLTLIQGYSSLLGTLVQDNPDARQLVEGISTGESRLLEVVNSMLDISKIDAQVLGVRKEPLSLVTALAGVCVDFDAVLAERHLKLTVADLHDLPTVQADPDLIFKLFSHLIGNAIKYTPDGGSIKVSGKAILKTPPEQNGGDWVELLVSDTGIGIDPAHHEMIFEKFYQTGPVKLHSSGRTKFKGGGPGLGLSIARGIVEAHGGRIWVESPGYDETTCPGSCFHVLLPVSDNEEKSVAGLGLHQV
jgi:signal transduction histidine kinase/CheY-like chemotaxis protein